MFGQAFFFCDVFKVTNLRLIQFPCLETLAVATLNVLKCKKHFEEVLAFVPHLSTHVC